MALIRVPVRIAFNLVRTVLWDSLVPRPARTGRLSVGCTPSAALLPFVPMLLVPYREPPLCKHSYVPHWVPIKRGSHIGSHVSVRVLSGASFSVLGSRGTTPCRNLGAHQLPHSSFAPLDRRAIGCLSLASAETAVSWVLSICKGHSWPFGRRSFLCFPFPPLRSPSPRVGVPPPARPLSGGGPSAGRPHAGHPAVDWRRGARG